MTGRLVSEKLLVVENVTRSLPCKSFSGSHNTWCRCLAQRISMASSLGDSESELAWDGSEEAISEHRQDLRVTNGATSMVYK